MNRKIFSATNRCKLPLKSGQAGFTLLEILIAISIFSVGMLAIASMQIMSIKGNKVSLDVTEATNVATDQIESLMGLAWDHVDISVSGNPHTATVGQYNITWNVTDNAPIDNTKTINLLVDWSEWTEWGAKQVSIQHVIPRIL